jgi:succinate dehydrogenase flavin-adding protein (antitoxin of CptAB toxin-antitoxin module)
MAELELAKVILHKHLESENEMDDIFKQQLFEKHEEENGNTFTEILNIQKDDITNMYFTVSSIQQDYFDSLDEN